MQDSDWLAPGVVQALQGGLAEGHNFPRAKVLLVTPSTRWIRRTNDSGVEGMSLFLDDICFGPSILCNVVLFPSR